MALVAVNPPTAEVPGPSKLDNAAKVLGIMTSLAQTGMGAYGASTLDERTRKAVQDAIDARMNSLMRSGKLGN